MRTRDIVRKAWQMTQVHLRKLLVYGFVPAFFSIVISGLYFAYQYHAFKTSVLFSDNPDSDVLGAAKILWGLVSSHATLSIVTLVVLFFLGIGYIFIPAIFRGIMIQAVDKIRQYEPIKGSAEVGVRRFFPMFEFGILMGAFSITTLFTESSFVLRWWGEAVFFVALPILLFVAMVGLVLNFLFTYAEFYIVLERKPLIRAMMDSTILVVSNLRKTFLIFVLIVLISLRIVLNLVLVLLIPMLVVFLSSFFTSFLSSVIGWTVILILGLGIVGVSSYLLALFHIFTTSVWVLTFAFISGKEAEKIQDVDLDTGAASE